MSWFARWVIAAAFVQAMIGAISDNLLVIVLGALAWTTLFACYLLWTGMREW